MNSMQETYYNVGMTVGSNMEDRLREVKAFGRALRTYRKRLGLSQKEVGDVLGFDQSTISGWERLAEPPTDFDIYADLLAQLLRADPEMLRRGEVEPLPVMEQRDWLASDIRRYAPDVEPGQARAFLELLNEAGPEDREAARIYLEVRRVARKRGRTQKGGGYGEDERGDEHPDERPADTDQSG